MDSIIRYSGSESGGPSYDLWRDAPLAPYSQGDFNVGCGIADDFMNFGMLVASNVGGYAGYKSFEDTTATIKQLQGEAGGGIRFSTPASSGDNLEAWLQGGYTVGNPFVIVDATPKDLWYECRLRWNNIADDQLTTFAGLGEEGMAAADMAVDDTGVMADKDFIGFHRINSDGDAIDFSFKKAGQTVQKPVTGLQTLVADTYYNFGFRYEAASKKIHVFVDGVKKADFVTAAETAAATFPDSQYMHVLAGAKSGADALNNFDMKWWRCFQAY